MALVELFALALALWSACGAVIAIGRAMWSIDTTLRYSRRAAPISCGSCSDGAPGAGARLRSALRAAAIRSSATILDAAVVAAFRAKLRDVPKRPELAALRGDFRGCAGRRRLLL